MFNLNLFLKILDSISVSLKVVGTLFKALFEFILKAKGRSWKTVFTEVLENKTKETEELIKVVKDEAHVIKDIVTKVIDSNPTSSNKQEQSQTSGTDKQKA